jgi:hypothetical protein
MELQELPATYEEWLPARLHHLNNDLQKSKYTDDLFKQYKKHLGAFRYRILLESQMLVVPPKVKELLGFRSFSLLTPTVPIYKLTRKLSLDKIVKAVLLPPAYKKEIEALDIVT